MRTLLILLLVTGGGWWSAFQRIRDANEAQQLAEAAFRRRDFATAAGAFARAQELGVTSERLQLNLGHAYTQLGNATAAQKAYGELTNSPSATTRSVARQQLAVLAAQGGNYAQATSLLRLALLDDPTNRTARYNYELLRAYQGRRDSPQIPPAPPPPPPAREPQGSGEAPSGQRQPGQATPQPTGGPGSGDAPGTTGGDSGAGTSRAMAQGSEPGTERGLDPNTASEKEGQDKASSSSQAAAPTDRRVITRQRLQTLNLSEAQARQLLDALQAAEQQYLRQIPHRATRRPDPRKPAW